MLNDAEWQGNDESNKNKNLHETWHSRLQNIQYKKRQPKAKLKPIEFIRRTITFAVFVGIRLLGHYYATSWRTSNMGSKLPLLLIVCHYIQSLFVCSCVGLHCGWRAVDIRWFESSIRVLRKWKKEIRQCIDVKFIGTNTIPKSQFTKAFGRAVVTSTIMLRKLITVVSTTCSWAFVWKQIIKQPQSIYLPLSLFLTI